MRHLLVIYWCCIFHMLCATSGGRYISSVDLPLEAYQDSYYDEDLDLEMLEPRTHPGIKKFTDFLRRQRNDHPHLSDDEFTHRMFLFMDLNNNKVIEKFEFRNALSLLGILDWKY